MDEYGKSYSSGERASCAYLRIYRHGVTSTDSG